MLQVGEERAAAREAAPERTGERAAADVRVRHLESRLARAEHRLALFGLWLKRLRASPLYRLLVRCGLWRRREAETVELTSSNRVDWKLFPPPMTIDRLELPRSNRPSHQGAVAVDLSSLLPGAENGGAKAVALAVVEELSRTRPEENYLVLIDPACSRELSGLAGANVKLIEMPVPADRTFERLVDEHEVKVQLCPMTTSIWADPRVPRVCVIHDLQHRVLPWFFDDEERDRRDDALDYVASAADEIISVSSSTRRHLLRSAEVRGGGQAEPMPADRITVIYNRITDRLPKLDEEEIHQELSQLDLEVGGFALYPANFWPHKNHQALLHGFSLFRFSHRQSQLRLVLTGALSPDPAPVLEAVRRLGLEGWVMYLGFVEERQLAALYRGGRALIFPSLFEGFGIPLVEAMANGLPVFASRLDVHQEVAQGAAEFFEPRSPEEIASVFERIDTDRELLEHLKSSGQRQARRLGDVRAMGEDYWRVLERAAARSHESSEVHGRYPDGWTTERFLVTHAAPCELVLELCNPLTESVVVELGAAGQAREVTVPSGRAVRVHCDLAADGGWIEGTVTPSHTPAGDPRSLGVMMRHCFEFLEDGVVLDLLADQR